MRRERYVNVYTSLNQIHLLGKETLLSRVAILYILMITRDLQALEYFPLLN